jgi:hypothetical protein
MYNQGCSRTMSLENNERVPLSIKYATAFVLSLFHAEFRLTTVGPDHVVANEVGTIRIPITWYKSWCHGNHRWSRQSYWRIAQRQN